MLKANEYGNVFVDDIEKDCVHVAGKNLQPLCRKLSIDYVPVRVGWGGTHRYPKPHIDGIAIYAKNEKKLRQAIAEREERAKSRRRKERIASVRYYRKFTPSQRKLLRSDPEIRLPSGETWKRKLTCADEAAFVLFLSQKDRIGWLAFADWLDEHDAPTDAKIIRDQQAEYERAQAGLAEVNVSPEWRAYLEANEFYSATAIELARVLKKPELAVRQWFVKAISAVEEYRENGEELTYEKIRRWVRQHNAPTCWNCGERGHLARDCDEGYL